MVVHKNNLCPLEKWSLTGGTCLWDSVAQRGSIVVKDGKKRALDRERIFPTS